MIRHKFIRPTFVKRLAHARGRRVSSSYLAVLDDRVRGIIEADCHTLRGGVTLRAGDALLRWGLANPTVRRFR